MLVIELLHPLDHEDVGAKAANLARAADVGLSVPPGVVVTRQTLFWGSALNHRILRIEVAFRKLGHLFREMQRVLLEAGLCDDIDDVVYFTADDLRVAGRGAPGRGGWIARQDKAGGRLMNRGNAG